MFHVLADAASDANASAAFAALSAAFGTIMIVGLAIIALTVWLFWRIFTKAGMNGALALLCLIPSFGWLICILILAFSTWPSEVPPASRPIGGVPMAT